jgi:hypothetical protein
MQKTKYFFIIVGFLYLILITSFTFIYGENLKNFFMNSNISKINELELFYIATKIECLNSKQLKSHPYIMFKDVCVEKATIKGVGKIVNNETFVNTVLENKIVFGQGNGTISTEDGQSISWKSFDANLLKGEYPGYRGIIYFNSTLDHKFAFLNNTVAIYESDSDTIRSIWLWE